MAERRFTLSFTEAELGTLITALGMAREDYTMRAANEAHSGIPHWQSQAMSSRVAALKARAEAAAAALSDEAGA